jgi:hypothetical protein
LRGKWRKIRQIRQFHNTVFANFAILIVAAAAAARKFPDASFQLPEKTIVFGHW